MKKDMAELIEILEKNKNIYTIFKQCPYEILKEIRVCHYKKNEFVLEQGEIHNTFYIIVSGNVDIYVESNQGKKYFLNRYGKGQYLGELEVFQQRPYVSGIEAEDNLTLLEIDRDVFLKWLRTDSNFSEYMLETLCETSYAMCKNMCENTLNTLKQRICQFLIDNTEQYHTKEIFIKTEILGSQMAVTQRSVNRVMKQLKESGIIELSNNSVIIKDYGALLEERKKK